MIGIAVVGYGYWGPNLARNIADASNARLSSIVDSDRDRLDAAAQRHPGASTTTDFDAMLANREVDAVAIATSVSQHYPMALAALQAGKHVLVEKPMTETSEQGRRLIDEAERRRLVLMVDHTFVYTGAVRKIADLLKAGELGRFYYYDSLRMNLGLFQPDVNVISDLAVHDFAILDHLLDEHPAAVSANGLSHFSGTPENLAYVSLFYASGAIAHVNVNWLAPVKMRRSLIGGSKKMLVYDDMEPSEKIKIYDKGISIQSDPDRLYKLRIDYRAGDMWAPKIDVTEALQVECTHFADCIATNRRPTTDGQAGLRVVEIIEAACESMRRGGRAVELSLRADSAGNEAAQ